MTRTTLLFFCCTWLTRSTVFAQTSEVVPPFSDTVVVTAARAPESLSTATESVTVLTTSDLQAIGATSLADALRTVPGLYVESNGREGALASLFSRGGESDYNLLLIDGVRVNQSGGAVDLSRIAAAEIERIEIVRGAQSALWGSDAMGATIQVITRRGRASSPPAASGSFEGGSFGTVRADARVTGGAAGRVDYAVGVTHRRTDGAFADILPQDDRFEQSTIDASAGATLARQATVRGGVRYSTADGASAGQIAYGIRNTGGQYDTRDLSWHAGVDHRAGRYTGSATIEGFRSRSVSADTVADPTIDVYAVLAGTPGARFPESPRLVRLVNAGEYAALAANPAALGPGEFLASTPFGVSNFPFSTETEFRRPAFRYQGDVVWGGRQRLTAGYDWEREDDALVDGQSLTNHALFVQQRFEAGDRWFVTAGLRVDDKSAYDAFVSPRLSAGGLAIPYRRGALSSLRLFANVGKGIKSPTFVERFGGAFADASPDLKVERARTADAGVDATFVDQRLRAGLTWFDNRYRDQIEFVTTSPFYAPDGRPDYINIAGSNARGLELEGALQRPWHGLSASASYSLVDTEVVETRNTGEQYQPGQPLLRRPKHSGAIRIDYVAHRLVLHWDTRVAGERHDSAFLSLTTLDGVSTDITVNPGYAVSGFGAEFVVHPALTLTGRVDNVFDRSYESALGYPALPRAIRVGVHMRMP